MPSAVLATSLLRIQGRVNREVRVGPPPAWDNAGQPDSRGGGDHPGVHCEDRQTKGTVCFLKQNKHNLPFPAEPDYQFERLWLCSVVWNNGLEAPAPKPGALWGWVCMIAFLSFLSFPPLTCLSLVLSVNLFSAKLFLPTELLLLSYCGGTKPHPCIKLALCVRYKLISGYQGQACPCPDIRIRGRV